MRFHSYVFIRGEIDMYFRLNPSCAFMFHYSLLYLHVLYQESNISQLTSSYCRQFKFIRNIVNLVIAVLFSEQILRLLFFCQHKINYFDQLF